MDWMLIVLLLLLATATLCVVLTYNVTERMHEDWMWLSGMIDNNNKAVLLLEKATRQGEVYRDNARMRMALVFYAGYDTYHQDGLGASNVKMDGGTRAREALADSIGVVRE